jgi:hypothetical protein
LHELGKLRNLLRVNPDRNPFSPGAGAPPPVLVGRSVLLRSTKASLARLKAGKASRSVLVVGLRGTGKTVLLNEIEGQAIRLGFKTMALETPEDKPLPLILLPHLRKMFLDLGQGNDSSAVKAGLRIFRSFLEGLKKRYGDIEISFAGESAAGAADSGDLAADLTAVLVALGEAAVARNTAIAIIIDEMQYIKEAELAALITAIHRVTQRGLPVLIAGAGLPQLCGNTINARSYAERLFTFAEIGALSPSDAKLALQKPAAAEGARFAERTLAEIIRLTRGYPYFVQAWGHYVWNFARKSPIGPDVVRKAQKAATADLDKNFFRHRFERLNSSEKGYLGALAQLGAAPQRSGEIAKRLGRTSHAVGTIRDGLIRKGMLYSPKYGQTAFTVPLFDEFVTRATSGSSA